MNEFHATGAPTSALRHHGAHRPRRGLPGSRFLAGYITGGADPMSRPPPRPRRGQAGLTHVQGTTATDTPSAPAAR